MTKIKNILNKAFDNNIMFTGLLFLSVLFVTFVIFKPYYQLCDDNYLRYIVDGSYSINNTPTEFMLWSNIFYGKILSNLYKAVPNFNWYDSLTYIYLSLCLITCSLSLFKKEEKFSYYNVFLFLTLFFLFGLIFIAPQFTITAACCAVSTVAIMFYVLTNKTLQLYKRLLLYLLALFFSLIGASIRFEGALSVVLPAFAGFIFLFNKNNLKKYLEIFTACTIIAIVIFSYNYKGYEVIKNNTLYNNLLEENSGRLDLTERTFAFDSENNYSFPWVPIEKKIKNLDEKLEPLGWSKGTYRALYYFLNIGDENLYNNTKYKEVYNVLKTDISIKNNFKLKFKVADFYKTEKYLWLLLILLILLFPQKRLMCKNTGVLASLFIILLLMGTVFKAIPPRVWTGMFLTTAISMLYLIKTHTSEKFPFNSLGNVLKCISNKELLNKIVICVFVIVSLLFIIYGFKPIKKMGDKAVIANKTYDYLEKQISLIDKNKVYLTDNFVLEHYSIPFKKSLFHNDRKIILTSVNPFLNKERAKKYGIPLKKDTLRYFVDNDNIEYLTLNRGLYNNFYLTSNKLAIKQFMKDNYNLEIVFVCTNDTEYTNFKTIAIKSISKEDAENANKLKIYQSYNDDNSMEKRLFLDKGDY